MPLVSVQVIHAGPLASASRLADLIGPSSFIGPGHLARLQQACADQGLDPAQVLRETDPSIDMEGLYIKVEEGGAVVERYKYIRRGFLTSVLNADSHWLDRPIVPNLLEPGADIFAAGSEGPHP